MLSTPVSPSSSSNQIPPIPQVTPLAVSSQKNQSRPSPKPKFPGTDNWQPYPSNTSRSGFSDRGKVLHNSGDSTLGHSDGMEPSPLLQGKSPVPEMPDIANAGTVSGLQRPEFMKTDYYKYKIKLITDQIAEAFHRAISCVEQRVPANKKLPVSNQMLNYACGMGKHEANLILSEADRMAMRLFAQAVRKNPQGDTKHYGAQIVADISAQLAVTEKQKAVETRRSALARRFTVFEWPLLLSFDDEALFWKFAFSIDCRVEALRGSWPFNRFWPFSRDSSG